MLRRFFRWWRQHRRARARGIFRYHDGTKWRLADPIAVQRACDLHPSWIPKADLGLMCQPGRMGQQAAQRGIEALREIFGIPPLEQGGLTEEEIWEVWIAFCDFLGELKKNSKMPPIGSPPTDGGQIGSDPSITPLSSDCGSTEAGSPTAECAPS